MGVIFVSFLVCSNRYLLTKDGGLLIKDRCCLIYSEVYAELIDLQNLLTNLTS